MKDKKLIGLLTNRKVWLGVSMVSYAIVCRLIYQIGYNSGERHEIVNTINMLQSISDEILKDKNVSEKA